MSSLGGATPRPLSQPFVGAAVTLALVELALVESDSLLLLDE
jgi:hypothetical protein